MASYNVTKFGAAGDGKTDDTDAFNRAVKALGEGDTLSVPEGKYMIDAEVSVRLKSNMTFKMLDGAELHVIPNDKQSYRLLRAWGVDNINISGGWLVGDRNEHKGTEGEWGMGLDIRGASTVNVFNVKSRDMWGDGFYIDHHREHRCRNVVLNNVVADRNRRQGLSVIDVSGLLVKNSVFKNTKGTRPMDGIDFECDRAHAEYGKNLIEDVVVTGCRFYSNKGAGVEFALKKGIGRNLRVTNCKFGNNGKTIKSDTFNWWQKIWYEVFGGPTSIKI